MERSPALIDPYNRARQAGFEAWGDSWIPSLYAVAPGRVEVLGNHVDYNGGPVLAAAIDRFTLVLAEETGTEDGVVEVAFADRNSAEPVRVAPGDPAGWRNRSSSQRPGDFVRGAVASLLGRGKPIGAARCVVASSVPIGVGVSSSAALCVAMTLALCQEPLEFEELVLIAQEAEHRAGTPCGTMDQSASIAGGMIRFDGSNLSPRQLDPDLEGHAFLVIDSGVKRSLVDSSYPRRVEECRQALARINAFLGTDFANLASVTLRELEQVLEDQHSGIDPVLLLRARHVVTEIERVNHGEAALVSRDWLLFGRLMTASGRSSATDYEISHVVVEDLVQQVTALPGVLGARMMGGGEGGSLIALIEPDNRGAIRERAESVVSRYALDGTEPRLVHRFNFAPGARRGRIQDILVS
ncbi:galactokinase [soil metagenome]